MTKIRLVNTAGTPLTSSALEAGAELYYIGYNTKDPSKVVREEILPPGDLGFTNGKLVVPEFPLAKMDVVKTLNVGALLEDIGFYRSTTVTLKVSKDCRKNPEYVDYDAQLRKLADEITLLNQRLDAAKKAGDDALVAELKDQIAKTDDLIKAAEEGQAKQEEAGITPTICVMDKIPTAIDIPLKQIVRTPEQQAERRDDINRQILQSAIKKLAGPPIDEPK